MHGPDVDEHDELRSLRQRLADAEEALRAIRTGEIDAIVVNGPAAPIVYTLKSADSPYRLLVEQTREGALTVSSDGVILYCNAAFAKMVGHSSERLRGMPLTEVIPGLADRDLVNLFQAGGSPGHDIRLCTSSGELRDAYISSVPMTIENERVHCVAVTDLTRQQLRLRNDAIVSSSVDAIYSLTQEGIIATWNPAAEHLYGYTPQEVIGRHVQLLVPPEQQDMAEAMDAYLTRQRYETVHNTKAGKQIDVALSLAPIGGPMGGGISVIARDITARKRSEEHVRFLLGEMSHRSKNLLAIIQAIASQTARSAGTIDHFRTRFLERLLGLAASHDLLVNTNWKGASLAALVRQQLSAFVGSGARLVLDGPDIAVLPNAAQNIGLALNELATNAMKYGALSVITGTVTAAWAIVGDGTERRLRLSWLESGGPPVTPPAHTGFGNTIINSIVPLALEGKATTDYAPAGFRWEFEIAATHIVEDIDIDKE